MLHLPHFRPATGRPTAKLRWIVTVTEQWPAVERTTMDEDGLTTPRDHDCASSNDGDWRKWRSFRPTLVVGKLQGTSPQLRDPQARFFWRFGERTEPSPTTSDVCWKSDVEAEVDTPGADVAAEVGDKDGEVEHERVADISPTRADVIHDASRADVIHDARAEVIHDSRADVIHDARADVIHPRADITQFYGGKKTATWGKNRRQFPCLLGTSRFTLVLMGLLMIKLQMHSTIRPEKCYLSSRPTKQNGEVVVRSLHLILCVTKPKRWKSTAVGYFM
ncbi:UNVERIFIED_CONTAM: hypothetical protein Sindi_2648400, partial [Sesamum indicum]